MLSVALRIMAAVLVAWSVCALAYDVFHLYRPVRTGRLPWQVFLSEATTLLFGFCLALGAALTAQFVLSRVAHRWVIQHPEVFLIAAFALGFSFSLLISWSYYRFCRKAIRRFFSADSEGEWA